MQNRALTLSHPLDDLEMYEWDPSNWDYSNPPELYVIDKTALIPFASTYMPPLFRIEVESKGRVEIVAGGKTRQCFKLTRKINPLWLKFYEKYRGDEDVSFAGDTLILSCPATELDKTIEEIAHRLFRATNEYREERGELLSVVFKKMEPLRCREELEYEILAEFNKYRAIRRELEAHAKERGYSAPVVIEHYLREYKEILHNKFTLVWGKILDAETIRHYRAAFEQEFLVR